MNDRLSIWNPHGLPLDRPFLVHVRRPNGVVTGITAFVKFAHEAGDEKALVCDLNTIAAIGYVADENIVAFSEIPRELHETLVWRCPRRYKNSPIARELAKHDEAKFREEHENYFAKAVARGQHKRAEYYNKILNSYEFFDDNFVDGKYIGAIEKAEEISCPNLGI